MRACAICRLVVWCAARGWPLSPPRSWGRRAIGLGRRVGGRPAEAIDDSRVAVLDFGSTLPMPDGWSPRLAQLLRAGRDRDGATLLQVATATGLVGSGDVTSNALLDLLGPALEPLRHETFSFTRQWLRSLTVRFSDPRSSVARTQKKLRLPVR